jgi:transcriptional regulator with XRE-family HTH domain
MEKAVTKRIKSLMDEFGDNKNSLSVKIGMASSTFGRYVNGENKPTVSLLQSILSQYEDVSADWLLMGKGAMYKTTELPPVDVSSEESIEHSAEIARLVREKNEMADIIEAQAKEIDRLQAQLDWASSIIKDSLREEPAQKVG